MLSSYYILIMRITIIMTITIIKLQLLKKYHHFWGDKPEHVEDFSKGFDTEQ